MIPAFMVLSLAAGNAASPASKLACFQERADEPYLEIDLGPVPCEIDREWKVAIKVDTEKVTFSDKVHNTGITDRSATCEALVLRLRENGFKAEVIDKSKIRVYGHTKDGKFYPVTKGSVETEGLKKEELPKVKNPPKA